MKLRTVLGCLLGIGVGGWVSGQEPVHIGGEGAIGVDTLTAVDVEGVAVAAIPGGAWSADGGEGIVESMLTSPELTVAEDGDVILTFEHRYNFEDDGTTRWDGGAVYTIVNGSDAFDGHVSETQFTMNPYDGAGPGEDGRFLTGNSPMLAGLYAFNNTSPGFADGATITSVANLGTFAAGDTLQVIFWGSWDDAFIQTPAPNWEVQSVEVSQAGGALLERDFSLGDGGFVSASYFLNPPVGSWTFKGSAPVVFEIDADTLASDRIETDQPGEGSVIDLNGVQIVVNVIAGVLDVGETFDLFEGGTLRGSYSGITLPDGQWDLSGLEEGGDGTITYVSTELSGWLVRVVDVDTAVNPINDLIEADLVLEDLGGAGVSVQSDVQKVYPVVDLGDNGGTFPNTQLYPDGASTGHEDLVVEATAQVVIPPGEWTIAFGSDDGGSLTVPGVDFSVGDGGFESRFNENYVGGLPLDPPVDTVRFETPRGHQWTGGTFVLTEPLETTITARMYERGGGDSFEVAIVDVSDPTLFPPLSSAEFASAPGVALLGNGVMGWEVLSGVSIGDSTQAEFVAGKDFVGDQSGSLVRENAVFDPPVESPGLSQEWWQTANPGNKGAVDGIFGGSPATNGPFFGTDGGGTGTWWTGNGVAIPGVQAYPPATTLARDNYVTRLTGEILIPESGLYRFKDGVDDFCYFAIDLDGNGVFEGNEILINDNAWVGTEGVRGGLANPNTGSPIGEADITVAEGGQWLAMEFNTGEGGGGDSGVLYWDYDETGGGIGAGVGFPEFQDDPIDPALDAAGLLIPDTHLRATVEPLVSADLVVKFPHTAVFDIGAGGRKDRVLLTNPDRTLYTLYFDLEGVDLELNVLDGVDLVVGTRYTIMAGGAIRGNYRSVTVPAGTRWDLSGLAPGGNRTVEYLGSEVVDVERFEFTDVAYEEDPQKVVLTWKSKAGHRYLIEASTDGKDWANWELVDQLPSAGDGTTSYDHVPGPGETLPRALIYRVTDLGMAP